MENAVILDVEATPTRISKEVDATETMIERTEQRFDLKPDYIAGDVAYGTGKMLGWLVERKIDPHIPVWDKGKRNDGKFSRQDFAPGHAEAFVLAQGDLRNPAPDLPQNRRTHRGTQIPHQDRLAFGLSLSVGPGTDRRQNHGAGAMNKAACAAR